MRKAICIKDGQWYSTTNMRPEGGPSYLEEVTIVGEFEEHYYLLAEYPFPDAYWKSNFILLGDYDERERLEAWKESAVKADALFEALAEMAPAEPMPQDAFDRVWKGIDNKLNRTYE